jgi:hypothetical protein
VSTCLPAAVLALSPLTGKGADANYAELPNPLVLKIVEELC